MCSSEITSAVPQHVVNISHRSMKTASSYLKSGKNTIKKVAKKKILGAFKSEDIVELDKND